MCRTPFDPSTAAYFQRLPYLEQKLLWTLEMQGGLTTVKAHQVESEAIERKPRSPITRFSRRSRYRLLQWLSRINWNKIKKGLFITLTYSDETIELDPRERNSQRWQWHRDMENHLCKQFPLLWRIEWLPRKSGKNVGLVAPHFHLILPTVKWIDHWIVADAWKRIIGAKRRTSYKVESLDNEKKHAIYVTKYCGKVQSASYLDDVSYLNIRGRHWGFHRPRMIPTYQKVRFENLPIALVVKLQCAAAQFAPWYDPTLDTGFSIFGKFGDKISSYVRKLCLDEGMVPCLE